jgi:glucosamine-6-phosphate deaminase
MEKGSVIMNICVYENPKIMGVEAAAVGARAIREAIAARGQANVILATGASQFTMLEQLVKEPGIDWSKVVCFHLDEYVGMSIEHPASFRKYLRERFADRLPSLREFNYIHADATPLSAEIERLGAKISKHPIDVAFIGIGENGHLAFNDPPADFETEAPYIVVDLDEKCRLQQVGEGWFKGMSDVPAQAVSMSIRHIMKSAKIVCSVPDARKADAVDMALNAGIAPVAPCSMLRTHPDCHLMLDRAAASKVLRAV